MGPWLDVLRCEAVVRKNFDCEFQPPPRAKGGGRQYILERTTPCLTWLSELAIQ
jgi:hypothetical protein